MTGPDLSTRWLSGLCAVLLSWGVWIGSPPAPADIGSSICRAVMVEPGDTQTPGQPEHPGHGHCALCQLAPATMPPPAGAMPSPSVMAIAAPLPVWVSSERAADRPGPYASRAPPLLA
jgi:hypothetical protein